MHVSIVFKHNLVTNFIRLIVEIRVRVIILCNQRKSALYQMAFRMDGPCSSAQREKFEFQKI